MKRLFALFASALLCSLAAHAQEGAAPKMRGGSPAPADPVPDKSSGASKTNDSVSLIPDNFEPVPKPKGGAIEGGSEQKIDKTTAAEDELKARILFRECKTKAERDLKVIAELERSNLAKTDYERREARKAYYKLLYGKVVKMAPSLAKRANAERDLALRRMEETRIAPTEPLDPSRSQSQE